MNLKEAKGHVRDFLQKQYSDENLVKLLDHCRAGKFQFASCCCFVGIVTADHELMSEENYYHSCGHYLKAQHLVGALDGERGARVLGFTKEEIRSKQPMGYGDNQLRTRLLIPLAMAEIKRRQKEVQREVPQLEEAPLHRV